MNLEITITFIVYFLVMLAIGFYFFNKNKNSSDYFVGNKTIGPITSALSAGASDMSGWLLMGLPGALYVGGLSQGYIALGLVVGALLNWLLVAKRLRAYSGSYAHCITILDYFEIRFQDNKHAIRLVCAVVVLLFFTFYVASGLIGGAKLFESTFHINYYYALSIGSMIVVVYTFLGGYKAVCYTDMIQGLLMMAALLVVPLAMIYHLGGIDDTIAILKEVKSSTTHTGTIAIISALAWGLGYFGQPHILIRFMSIKSTKEIPIATFIGIAWMVISLAGACLIGIIGMAYIYKFNLSLNDPEKIFIVASQIIFNPWIAGILLSAILAAIMSTASSQLLISSATIAEDLYKKVFKKEAAEKTVIALGRLGVIAVAGISFIIALNKETSILGIVAYAWAGFGASFGSVMLFSLFWDKMSKEGAIAGMICGASMVVLYKHYLANIFNLHIYEIVPAFLCASIAIIVVSLINPASEKVKNDFHQKIK